MAYTVSLAVTTTFVLVAAHLGQLAQSVRQLLVDETLPCAADMSMPLVLLLLSAHALYVLAIVDACVFFATLQVLGVAELIDAIFAIVWTAPRVHVGPALRLVAAGGILVQSACYKRQTRPSVQDAS